jgi:hypothetical protein
MRHFLSEQIVRRTACALVALSFLFVSGCNLNPSRNDVVGTYVLRGQGGNLITLTLSSDGVFSEKILASGNFKTTVGTWSIRDGNLDFDQLWIPQAFAPQTIVEADKRAGERQPKYTEPGHWDLSVEKLWGRMKIEVFSDDDVEFVMVSHT